MSIVLSFERSRTNISERTRQCVGTDERPCAVVVDISAGRLRCLDCRLEQQTIAKRKRNERTNAERRKQIPQRITLTSGLHVSMMIKHVDGISGLPRIGIAHDHRCAFLVIEHKGFWMELTMQELDRRIAEKTRIYLDRARELIKPGV